MGNCFAGLQKQTSLEPSLKELTHEIDGHQIDDTGAIQALLDNCYAREPVIVSEKEPLLEQHQEGDGREEQISQHLLQKENEEIEKLQANANEEVLSNQLQEIDTHEMNRLCTDAMQSLAASEDDNSCAEEPVFIYEEPLAEEGQEENIFQNLLQSTYEMEDLQVYAEEEVSERGRSAVPKAITSSRSPRKQLQETYTYDTFLASNFCTEEPATVNEKEPLIEQLQEVAEKQEHIFQQLLQSPDETEQINVDPETSSSEVNCMLQSLKQECNQESFEDDMIFCIGELVEFEYNEEWKKGIVTSTDPLMVRYAVLEDDEGLIYENVRKMAQANSTIEKRTSQKPDERNLEESTEALLADSKQDSGRCQALQLDKMEVDDLHCHAKQTMFDSLDMIGTAKSPKSSKGGS